MENKKVVFSGVQPSGGLTIGNYIGAIKNWVDLQDNYTCFFSVVDQHAITIDQIPKDLRKNTLDVLAMYIAAGIDPNKSNIFIQSHVPNHSSLGWVLANMTYMGELERMTQYKSKANKKTNNAGLFTYPVLMAADILLYNTDLVPVGDDQEQHLQLTRTLARRFNNKYSETFKVPEPLIKKEGARIMSLQDPSIKMSKSDKNPNSYILMLDTEEDIRRKFKKAVTDSCNKIEYNDEQPGMKNLINIYSAFSGKTIKEIEDEYVGVDYGRFKNDVAESVISVLIPIQEKYKDIRNNKEYLEEVYTKGAEKAFKESRKMLSKVERKIGFI